jgi:hypothetical protein
MFSLATMMNDIYNASQKDNPWINSSYEDKDPSSLHPQLGCKYVGDENHYITIFSKLLYNVSEGNYFMKKNNTVAYYLFLNIK